MKYEEHDRQSENVEDRHSEGRGGRFRFPGARGVQIPVGGRGGLSLTALLIVGALMLFFGVNPLDVLRGGPGPSGFPQMPELPRSEAPGSGGESASPFDIPGLPGGDTGVTRGGDEMKVFVSRVLADTEDVWSRVFKGFGRTYEPPKLVLFSGGVQTRCGTGMSAMGPFYCPLDRKVYIDLSFYDELKRRFQAPGDFAQAYVVAHEIGHHVQNLLGIAEKVQGAKQSLEERESNALQVRMELQADCLAGVWAKLNNQLKNRLEPGDIEEGLTAASAIGDDTLQKRQQGYVVPDAFTHGSSQQRVSWFKRGFETGQIQSCDTFK
jgi:predicted metalloprotease